MRSRENQNLWHFFFALFFAAITAGGMWILYRLYGRLPTSIPTLDVFLVTLATFRLIRLSQKDKITRFMRDWLKERRERTLDGGRTVVEMTELPHGPRRALSDLLGCPWCIGLWWAPIVTFLYFLTPLAWYPVLFLAVAGVATFVQLVANQIGWSAERGKMEAERLKRE